MVLSHHSWAPGRSENRSGDGIHAARALLSSHAQPHSAACGHEDAAVKNDGEGLLAFRDRVTMSAES